MRNDPRKMSLKVDSWKLMPRPKVVLQARINPVLVKNKKLRMPNKIN